jgi:TRAP transporter TAXI family solute receptor
MSLFIFSLVQSAELSIATGGKKGTYFQIGSDISNLARQHGLRLEVQESKGSLDNIIKINENSSNQIGIVQSDILEYLRASNDVNLQSKAKNITMISPLYNEEIHILTHDSSIRELSCLKGKKVAIGPERSGTAITASLLFKKSGITPSEIIYTSAEQALSSLRAKTIDAMIYVSGYPISLFSQIVAADKLHLVPIMGRPIEGSYIMSCIPAGTYKWQDNIVPTLAVKAVLAGYNYDEKQQHSREICEIGKIIYTNLDWLKKNGHSKWSNVRLNDKLTGWEKNRCIVGTVTALSSARF